jgi:hypothetical protein
VFSSRDLAALPWELGRAWDSESPLSQGPGVNVVYRCLRRRPREEATTRAAQAALLELGYYSGVADGLNGARTVAAVRAFQRDAGIEPDGIPGRHTFASLREAMVRRRPRRPLRVVVLRPDPARQLERQRGETAAGSALPGGYLQHGAAVRVVDEPTVERVRHVSRPGDPFVPDIVHVTAPVRFGGGATVLDLGGDAGQRAIHRGLPSSPELSVSALAELVHVLVRGGRLSLLVLDVPLPGTLTEALRAVGARNSFGYQVMSLGGVQALLATGLATAHDQIEIVDRVVGGLSRGLDVGQVARDVQHARPANGDDVTTALAFAGAALHVERPPFTLFPLWVS